MGYKATKHHVSDRGAPPDSFLDELIAWGKIADDDIFAPNSINDIYTSVASELGPYHSSDQRRGVMLEVLRVLAGFESSWDWNCGLDTSKMKAVTAQNTEAGAWQVSYDSMGWGPELRALLVAQNAVTAADFQRVMKQNHTLAMEYIARLLRRTVAANGPVVGHRIHPWLRRDAVKEFMALIRPPGDYEPPKPSGNLMG
jgi:hypothetical protein